MLDKLFPGVKRQYVRAFGNAYECPSPNDALLMSIFRSECVRHDMLYKTNDVFAYLGAFETKAQAR